MPFPNNSPTNNNMIGFTLELNHPLPQRVKSDDDFLCNDDDASCISSVSKYLGSRSETGSTVLEDISCLSTDDSGVYTSKYSYPAFVMAEDAWERFNLDDIPLEPVLVNLIQVGPAIAKPENKRYVGELPKPIWNRYMRKW